MLPTSRLCHQHWHPASTRRAKLDLEPHIRVDHKRERQVRNASDIHVWARDTAHGCRCREKVRQGEHAVCADKKESSDRKRRERESRRDGWACVGEGGRWRVKFDEIGGFHLIHLIHFHFVAHPLFHAPTIRRSCPFSCASASFDEEDAQTLRGFNAPGVLLHLHSSSLAQVFTSEFEVRKHREHVGPHLAYEPVSYGMKSETFYALA